MKKLLVVVDYQVDFVNGSLGFNGAEKLDEKICEKIKQYKEQGNTVVYTLDTHYSDYLTTQEGKNLPVEHCIQNTKGHKLFGNTNHLLKNERYFLKHTFGSDKLALYLKEEQFDQVEFVGLVSNICVLSNAVVAKTFLPNAKIIVDSSATDSFDSEMNKKALDIMTGLQIEVI